MIAVLLFDAVSVPLVERLLGEGSLPVLADLRARGRVRPIRSAVTYLGDRETAHTGVEVPEHGQTFPIQWSQGEQRLRPLTSFDTAESIWERVARAGGRSLVIDPYESRRPARDVGTIVSGWQFAHTAVLQRWSEPRGSYGKLAIRYGRAPEVEDVYGRQSAAGLEALRRQLLDAPDRVARLARHLLARQRYDLVWIELNAGHMAGHHFWDLGPLYAHIGARRRVELERTVADVYGRMDAALGEIVQALPAGTEIMVVSETGMAANDSRTDLLPLMLGRVLNGKSVDAGPAAGQALWALRAAVPARARMAVTRALPDRVALDVAGRLFLRGVDWRSTRAFALPADHDGYVRLNVRGRERDGVVDPTDVDALVAEIRAGLESFTDDDGVPSVAGVDRVEELVGRGARSDQLPDLVVRWSRRPPEAVPLAAVRSPRFGDVQRRGSGLGRSGNHVDGSWVVVCPGERTRFVGDDGARLVDVGATVASVLGVDTEGLAGEPLLASI